MQKSSISEKIKELRTNLEMNQKNFSAAIGIRQSTLSSYENGIVTPSNEVLLTIAQKFSCLTGLVVWIIRKQNTNFYSERCHFSFTPDE